MTVNDVLKVHLKAREIFTVFHVDCESDGCRCVDELKRSRGVDVESLLLVLQTNWN